MTPLSLALKLLFVISTDTLLDTLSFAELILSASNEPVSVTLLIPDISELLSRTTAFPEEALPGTLPLTILSSSAEAVIRLPPSFKPLSTPLCDLMSIIWFSPVLPILIVPELSCVITLLFSDCPSVRLLRAPIVVLVNKVPSIVNEPLTTLFPVISVEPLTFKSPVVISTLPVEFMNIFSLALPFSAVENDNLVELFVSLNVSSDTAFIDAAISLATPPDDSSGVLNWICPSTSSLPILTEAFWILTTAPPSDLEFMSPMLTWLLITRLSVSNCDKLLMFLMESISLLPSTIKALLATAVPGVTPESIFNSSALEIKSDPLIFNDWIDNLFNPDKSLLLSTTTALEFSTTPSAEVLFNLFNSSAVDFTRTLFSSRPPVIPLWDAIFNLLTTSIWTFIELPMLLWFPHW